MVAASGLDWQTFQFTRARGARPTRRQTRPPPRGFNSRAHGARDSGTFSTVRCRTFQFTRARGARHLLVSEAAQEIRFQFTRARGARRRTSPPRSGWCCFNSRAHGARDHLQAPGRHAVADVSIHARTGRATFSAAGLCARSMFQFTRARGARQSGRTARGALRSCFNSRAHGARDEFVQWAPLGIDKFQFTRARGARPAPPASPSWPSVSIHARTGRATDGFGGPKPEWMFQFTRARGARQSSATSSGNGRRFQFTRARGARPQDCEGWWRNRVSIHARTGRATRSAPSGRSSGCFNSRAHGARDCGLFGGHSGSVFQFTRARGARLPSPPPRPRRRSFNSRAHGARDLRDERGGSGVEVSIHARTGRATVGGTRYYALTLFQFTRARGARQRVAADHGDEHGVSIHARTGRATAPVRTRFQSRRFNSRAHGARDRYLSSLLQNVWFQFTRARGARLPRVVVEVYLVEFQFTRARGARRSGS